MGFCWLIDVWSYKEYVCCVCDLSVCLGVPSICQICVCLYEGCDFRVNSEIEGSLAFNVLMLFLYSILCLMCSGMWSAFCLLGCCVCLCGECL